MELNWEELLSSKKGKFYLVKSRERDIDIFASKIDTDNANILVKIIRGKRCSTSASLNQEFGAALQFPYYSVHGNWDGFNDCINDLGFDLEVVDNTSYVYALFITHVNEVLSENPKDLNIFLDILKDTILNLAKETRNNIPNRAPIVLHIIFHCELENESVRIDRLKSEKVELVLRSLKPFDDIP